MRDTLATIAIVIIIFVGYRLYFKQETWLGFYYPNGCLTCTEQYIYSPEFKDRSACLSWATNLKASRNNPNDEYECGKNCKAPSSSSGLYVCEETVDY